MLIHRDMTTDELAAALKTLQQKRVSAWLQLVSLLIILMISIPVLTANIPCMSTEKDVHALTIKLLISIYKDSNLKNITSDENFNTFSYSWYNNIDVDPATGLTPYNNMQKVVSICHDFVDNFDNTFSNLLFIGQTGVGKTFLSNCIAKSLMDSYHSIIYLTAGEFFDSFKSRRL